MRVTDGHKRYRATFPTISLGQIVYFWTTMLIRDEKTRCGSVAGCLTRKRAAALMLLSSVGELSVKGEGADGQIWEPIGGGARFQRLICPSLNTKK